MAEFFVDGQFDQPDQPMPDAVRITEKVAYQLANAPPPSKLTKSTVRSLVLKALSMHPYTDVQICGDSLNCVAAGLSAPVVVGIVDATSCSAGLHKLPEVKSTKNMRGEKVYYIADPFSTVGDMCKSVLNLLKSPQSVVSSEKMLTVILADQAEYVMDVKSISRQTSANTSAGKLQAFTDDVHNLMHATLAEAYGPSRYYQRGVTKMSEPAVCMVPRADGTSMEMTFRSAEDLLSDADGLCPGLLHYMIKDRKVGRRAITRRITLFAATDGFTEVGQPLVFWGGAHALKPEDFGLWDTTRSTACDEYELLASGVDSMAVLIYKVPFDSRTPSAILDAQMVGTYFSALLTDQILRHESVPPCVGVACKYKKRMVLVNRMYTGYPFGEADHGVVRVLTHITHTPYWKRFESPAVLVCASDTDVLLYLTIAAESLRCAIPTNIYLDTDRPAYAGKKVAPMRYVNIKRFMTAAQHAMCAGCPEGSTRCNGATSFVAFLLLAGCGDYTDSFHDLGPKKIMQCVDRFRSAFDNMAVVHTRKTLDGRTRELVMLDVEKAVAAMIFLKVCVKKGAPTARSKRGITTATKFSQLTEEDISARSAGQLIDMYASHVMPRDYSSQVTLAASSSCKEEVVADIHRLQRYNYQCMPSTEEMAARISAVNKTLAAAIENPQGALVDLPSDTYGYTTVNPEQPISHGNIRHAHAVPAQLVDAAITAC